MYQGDVLYPMLFCLVEEVLGHDITNLIKQRKVF